MNQILNKIHVRELTVNGNKFNGFTERVTDRRTSPTRPLVALRLIQNAAA
jgi:hypothetical protein